MTESEIRRILVEKLEHSPAGEGAAFISEMFLADYSRRADLIMANGKLSVFEIKSSLDNLDRLEGQLENYLKYFERVIVVCASKHTSGVVAKAPASVGVWSIGADGNITIARKGRLQTVSNKHTWLSFLPVVEIRPLLKSQSLPWTGNRERLVELAETLSVTKVREYVLNRLKDRDKRIRALKDARQKRVEQVRKVVQDREKRLALFLESTGKLGAITATPRRIR